MASRSGVDLLLTAGKIITMTGGPDVTALAVAGGHIVWAGDACDAMATAGPGTRCYDFGPATITPGLIDAHLHTVHFGVSLSQVDLRPAVTEGVPDIIAKVADGAGRLPTGSWVLGRGYDQNRLAERRHPTRWELDQASPDRPVLITQNSGHMSVANSSALQAAGITRDTLPPSGGAIERDAQGEPTGLLQETAQQLVRQHIPRPSAGDIREALRLAHRQFACEGLTCVHEAGCPAGLPPAWLQT